MQKILYILTLIVAPYWLTAQVVTGSWYGHADVEMAGMHNNYLTELVLKQKGTKVEGIFGYYFRDKYQSFFIHGRYNPQTREVTILNIPIIYFSSNSTVNSIDCNTNFRGILMNSKLGSSVKGTFYHDDKYKYTCPDIKVSYTLDKSDNQHDSISTKIPVTARVWKPQEDDVVVDVAAAAPAGPTSLTLPPAKDTATATAAVILAPHIDSVAEEKKEITEDYSKRKNIFNKEFVVESDSVRISFYDNGDIDGDSISVFVNNQVVVTHQELASKAFNIYLKLDSSREVNEIGMFAENLGKIPPNTALMVVTDGKNRYEVFLTSSLTENATIQLRRKKKL